MTKEGESGKKKRANGERISLYLRKKKKNSYKLA